MKVLVLVKDVVLLLLLTIGIKTLYIIIMSRLAGKKKKNNKTFE